MKRSPQRSAFSLVEIVLALGITAFALSGVVGLFSVAATTGKASMDDTVLVAMANRAISDLRRQDFATLLSTSSVTPPATPAPVAMAPVFFDVSGQWLGTATTGIPAGATYRCTQTVQADAGTASAVNSSVRLLHVTLQFTWPAQAATPPNTKTIYANIAGH